MSAYILDDSSINKLANTLNFISEYGRDSVYQTKAAIQKFLIDLQIEKLGSDSSNGGIFLDEKQANNSAAKIADALYELNVRAVNFRYNENNPLKFTAFQPTEPIQSNYQLYKSLQCLMYQCSEGDIINTRNFNRLQDISDALAHDIVIHSKEYDLAKWN